MFQKLRSQGRIGSKSSVASFGPLLRDDSLLDQQLFSAVHGTECDASKSVSRCVSLEVGTPRSLIEEDTAGQPRRRSSFSLFRRSSAVVVPIDA